MPRPRQAGPSEGNPKGSVHQRIKTFDSGKSRTRPVLARDWAVFVSHFLLIKLRNLASNRQLRDEELILSAEKNVVSPRGNTTDILRRKGELATTSGGNANAASDTARTGRRVLGQLCRT